MFTRIGCQASAVEDLLGDSGVTESNILQYLGMIEQRTTEICQAYLTQIVDDGPKDDPNTRNVATLVGNYAQAAAQRTSRTVMPPTEIFSDTQRYESSMPYTRDDIMRLLEDEERERERLAEGNHRPKRREGGRRRRTGRRTGR